MNSTTPPTNLSAEARAFQRLSESNLYRTYQSAFHMATGLRVHLHPADEGGDISIQDGNPFCGMLNRGNGCAACGETHRCLGQDAEERTKTVRCFAGLKETAVPVRAGNRIIAFLRVGQVFTEPSTAADFEPVAQQLLSEGFSKKRIETLRQAFLNTEVVEPERYLGCVTLLNAFSLQLSGELSRLLIAAEHSDPPAVIKAKQYVNAHLEEKITLDEVSAHVCVSPYYFCKLFKQATGITLTEYVNRRRVEWAKRKLLNPQVRVTEVAYDVGYQSLSQFNRSFLKYAGQSPSHFRESADTESALRSAA